MLCGLSWLSWCQLDEFLQLILTLLFMLLQNVLAYEFYRRQRQATNLSAALLEKVV